jgi:osmotically-inducible protein OsmY
MDPTQIEGSLNRAIRDAGIKGIHVEVSDQLVATLKGSTTSQSDKSRALQIVRNFKGLNRVKDVIFVVQ